MARSVFYYHLKRLNVSDKYATEKETIKTIFYEHKGRYGYRRVTAEMRNRGVVINHKTVLHLMMAMGLKSRIRRVRYRSYKGDVGRVAPNIINRNFVATGPNRKWATDVTQINIGAAKLYLSPILDMFNGEIISYNISKSPNLEQVYDICLIKLLKSSTNSTGLYFTRIRDGSISITAIVNASKNNISYKACHVKAIVWIMLWRRTFSA